MVINQTSTTSPSLSYADLVQNKNQSAKLSQAVDKKDKQIEHKVSNVSYQVDLNNDTQISKLKESNSKALTERIVEKEKVTEKKNQIKQQNLLQGYEKSYPPFSADSKEREQYLKNLISLRNQIEQLTIPPDMNSSSLERPSTISDSAVSEIGVGIKQVLSDIPVGITTSGDKSLRNI